MVEKKNSSTASQIIQMLSLLARTAVKNTRTMSTSANVWINQDTRCIVQGFTGKQVRRLIFSKHKTGKVKKILMFFFIVHENAGNLSLRASNCIQQRHRRRWGLSWQRGHRKFRSSCLQFGQRSQRRHRRECQVSGFCSLLVLLPLLVSFCI